MNIANQITVARLVLAMVLIALLSMYDVADGPTVAPLLQACFWLFVIAAVSDVLDGYLARRLGQVTPLGRVLDPLVDKVLVCGALIMFVSSGFEDAEGRNITGVAPWMVVLIVVRELAVSALRGVSESAGHNFGASAVGKLKMFSQSLAVGIILASMTWPDISLLQALVPIAIWTAVIITALSMVDYFARGWRYLGTPQLEKTAGGS